MIKKSLILALLLSLFIPVHGISQVADSADVYMLTCAPGNASYSIYGHTALRVAVRGTAFDMVYNWGIFDFSTPNFAYRFAKGKLDYMLGAYSYQRFLEEYIAEERSVWSQKLNLTSEEKQRLFELIDENLKPENLRYRYDFFYDNCATRIRDILVSSATDSVIFPGKETKKSFRQLIDPYQKVLPWLDLGADILLGLQADRKASVADEMFLPMLLKENISGTMIVHDGAQEPIAGQMETVIDLPAAAPAAKAWFPQAVLWAVFVLVILVTFFFKKPALGKAVDYFLFLIYSVIALLLVFTNLFSDHDALHLNLLFIGINILIPVLFVSYLAGRKAVRLSRITFVVSALWLPLSLIAGQGINPAILPIVFIIMVRIFSHCRFGKRL